MPVYPPNTRIGKYRVETFLGAGGMGEVYRATNLETRAVVAVKVLTNPRESSTAIPRFRNEAVVQYNLRHPNVAALYEYLEHQGRPCIAMEFVEGDTLRALIRRNNGLDVKVALDLIAQVSEAVAFMHANGVVHRDIKSDNIRITPQGTAKVLDFGISLSKQSPALTEVGCVVGTPQNLAPEQLQGMNGGELSDIWAIGIMLYEMFTGVLPFDDSDADRLAGKILAGRYAPASELKPALPKACDRLLARCLCLEPRKRYASASLFLEKIRELRKRLNGAAIIQGIRPNLRLVAAGVLVVLVSWCLAYFSLSSSRRESREPTVRPSESTVVQPTPAPLIDATPTPLARTSPAAPAVNLPGGLTHLRKADGLQEIEVSLTDGPANVFDLTHGGRFLGMARDFRLWGNPGEEFRLRFDRRGYESMTRDVEIIPNHVYTYTLVRK